MDNILFLSLDLLIVIALFVILLLASFKYGKKLIVSLIISMYPTLLIFENLPFTKLNLNEETSKAIVFIICYVILVAVLWKNTHVKKVTTNFRKFLDYSLISATYLLLLFSIYINSVNYLAPFYSLSGITIEWVSKIPYSLALIIPIIILFMTNRKDLER